MMSLRAWWFGLSKAHTADVMWWVLGRFFRVQVWTCMGVTFTGTVYKRGILRNVLKDPFS